MTPEQQKIAQLEQQVELLIKKFGMLVGMVEKDMTAMKMEIAGLRAQGQQGGPSIVTKPEDEIVGMHPLTGAPVTRAMITADPKLKLRMMFTDTESA